jgi:hypothetical protein
LELAHQITGPVARGEDLEDDLGRNAFFLPLLVRAAIALGPADASIASGAVRTFGFPSSAYQREIELRMIVG